MPVPGGGLSLAQRLERRPISVANSPGSSQAAKWPPRRPRGSRRGWGRPSGPSCAGPEDLAGEDGEADRYRDLRRSLPGATVGGLPVLPVLPAAEAPVPVSQYSVMLSTIRSRVRWPRAARRGTRGRSCSSCRCRGRASRRPGRRVNPAGRSRSSAAGGLLEEIAVAAGLHGGDRVQRGTFGLGGFRWRRADQRRLEQVEVDAKQPRRCLAAHLVADVGAQVAALGDVAGVAQAAHQLGPRPRDAAGVPAGLGRRRRSRSRAGTAAPGRRRRWPFRRARPGR